MSRRVLVIAGLFVGYVGVYLCRKNYSVAVPLLNKEGVDEVITGRIASIGTAAYMIGKFSLGPLTDKIGARAAFLFSLLAVALFGALGGLTPSVLLLGGFYALNRFFGAGGWPAMMKTAPTWYEKKDIGVVVAVLSVSYVVGGILATLLATGVVELGFGWQEVMAFPSLALVILLGFCFVTVRPGPLVPPAEQKVEKVAGATWILLRSPRFLIVCALSFVLTLMRETFNTWSVAYLAQLNPGGSIGAASVKSTSFDIAGCGSILLMGVVWDKVPARFHRWVIGGVLALLAALLALFPETAHAVPASAPWFLFGIGLLVYGPYSLLAGALAVESGGARLAGSASGIIDGVGYAASILAGEAFGRIVKSAGYDFGFRCLAGLTVVAAVLALGLVPARSTK